MFQRIYEEIKFVLIEIELSFALMMDQLFGNDDDNNWPGGAMA